MPPNGKTFWENPLNLKNSKSIVSDGHYRIEKYQLIQYKLDSLYTGHLLLAIVHTHPEYRSHSICANHLDKDSRPITGGKNHSKCPIDARTMGNDTIYKTVMLECNEQRTKLMAHGAIVRMEKQDTIQIKFPLVSSDLKSKFNETR